MSEIFNVFVNFLGSIFNYIYIICGNYGITIVLFTIVSKIVLFPINILIQKNSIKMVKMKPKIEELKMKYDKDKDSFMEAQIELFEKEKYHPTVGVLPLLLQIPIILGLIAIIGSPKVYIKTLLDMTLFGIDLSVIPSFEDYMIIPILAAITTILLCLFQNKVNVLQREESFASKLATGILTVALTVYFVFYVPNGVGVYWCLGNLLGIIQLYILNFMFSPEKYIDYKYLEKIKAEKNQKKELQKIEKQKSKYYYKKFFKEENIETMKLVFYSEQSGFFKYFKGMIEYILENSDIVIHYVTSDLNDQIFQYNHERVVPYFINTNHLIPLFMKLECDVVVMTVPDLQNLYLKRSIVKKDIEYIFTDHGLGSQNLLYKQEALDHYDTIFAKNKKQELEIREIEKLRGTNRKKIIQTGYTLIDDMIEAYEKTKKQNEIKTILIAPSWQEDNIMESCIDDILKGLLNTEYKVIVRPHPQYLKRNSMEMKLFEKKYQENINDKFIVEKDFSSNETVYNADLIITDWSGIGYEFSFATTKPCLYVNTKMKILNSKYKDINVIPMDIEIRDKLGKCLEKEDLNNIKAYVDDLILNQGKYMKINEELRKEYIFNIGKAAEIEGKYIIERIGEKRNEEN